MTLVLIITVICSNPQENIIKAVDGGLDPGECIRPLVYDGGYKCTGTQYSSCSGSC